VRVIDGLAEKYLEGWNALAGKQHRITFGRWPIVGRTDAQE
jgi:hypothetical protein